MTISVEYSTRFVRAFRKLEPALQEEIIETVDSLKDTAQHSNLKVHKLHGKLSAIYSCSVNYRIRLTFGWAAKDVIVLESVGAHDDVY